MRVIHVPMSEMLWPPKKSRKLRWRKARHACEKSRGTGGEGCSCWALVWSGVMRLCFRCTFEVVEPIYFAAVSLIMVIWSTRAPAMGCCEITVPGAMGGTGGSGPALTEGTNTSA